MWAEQLRCIVYQGYVGSNLDLAHCRNLIKKPGALIRVPLNGSIRVTIRDL